jgi:hypothetical protein
VKNIFKLLKNGLLKLIPLDEQETFRKVAHLDYGYTALIVDRSCSVDVHLFDPNDEEVPVVFEDLEGAERYVRIEWASK